MAKKQNATAQPTSEPKTLISGVLTRIEGKDSKNYASFGKLPVFEDLGGKAQIIISRDGTLLVAKTLSNGTRAVRVTVTVEG